MIKYVYMLIIKKLAFENTIIANIHTVRFSALMRKISNILRI